MTYELPQPSFDLFWKGERGHYTVSKPNIGDTSVYTENQMREAYNQGLEDAAGKLEETRKAANELRDLCARMLNHIEDAPIDLSKMQEQAEIINKANEMLDELLLVK